MNERILETTFRAAIFSRACLLALYKINGERGAARIFYLLRSDYGQGLS